MKNNLLITLLFIFSVSCYGQQIVKNEILEGRWYLDLQHNDIGLARTFMHFETDDNSFEAYTRKNADRDILGGWTSMLGRTFTKSFKNGSLLRVVNGTHKTENDTLKLSGVLTSAMGNYHFKGYVVGNELYARLTNKIGEQRFTDPETGKISRFDLVVKDTDSNGVDNGLEVVVEVKNWTGFEKLDEKEKDQRLNSLERQLFNYKASNKKVRLEWKGSLPNSVLLLCKQLKVEVISI